MPNRGELPTPAARVTSAVKNENPDADAWAIIAFCAVGALMTFYFAMATVGTDAFPKLISQIPLG